VKKKWWVAAAIAAVCLFVPQAKSQGFRGSLVGVVEDSSGARVPLAKISVQQAHAPGTLRRMTADTHGNFRIDNLLPGSYEVTVTANGFAPASAEVTVEVSSTRSVTVTMRPAPTEQTVTVRGEASSITTQALDLTSSVIQAVVTQQDLQVIPLAARSFANIAYLAPGTEPVEPSDPTKARITAVSFGGSSGLNDVLTVDGVDNSDDYIGGFLQNFSPDVIQSFAVRVADEEADVGRTTGGSVAITTKHGTNQWHGDLAFYGRASALNARFPIDNPAPNPKQPFSRENYIGTIGGPIVKNKLWFFTGFEYVHENASIAYSAPNIQQFNALNSLAQQGLVPGVSSIPVPTSVPVPFRDILGSVRFDWTQSQNSRWFLRASEDNYTTLNDLVQQATLPSTGASNHSAYWNLAINNEYIFSPTWLATFAFGASYLHLTERRNSAYGYALAFPFSSTASTISGFETFGDQQFVTPITAFPVLRNQQKYEFRYDVSHASGDHAPRFGVDFIHEPVLSGALSGTAENLTVFAMNPVDYLANPAQFAVDINCTPTETIAVTPGTTCTNTPASDGTFSQNVQRLGVYFQDTWRITPQLTVNYGMRYDTTWGLFTGSGRSQLQNPALLTMKALRVPGLENYGAPHNYHAQFGPRLGIAYAFGKNDETVFRAGAGLYYNDLAQNGWVAALQAVNAPPAPCVNPGDPGCLPGAADGGAGAIIDPNYKTPYAFHATAGFEHAWNPNWTLSGSWVHEQGVHAYRAYSYVPGYTLFSPLFPATVDAQQANVPAISVFRTDNRSRYDAMFVHLQGNIKQRMNLVVNYTLASAATWGCVVGELFDYVNGVCNPLDAFAPGDYGPSGEDVRNRLVIGGIVHLPAGFEISTLSQFESARPFTMTTPVDANGNGDPANNRAVVNGVTTSLDQFRGTPYIQIDMRVSRPFVFKERWTLTPFVEFFNLLNRNNPGNNYITDLAALPTPVNNLFNATAFCTNADCTQTQPINNLNQLAVPAGALGDFFGPGTTVGIPFAAQLGARLTF
jgi:hypothetical protein